jgi:hypothetical protein
MSITPHDLVGDFGAARFALRAKAKHRTRNFSGWSCKTRARTSTPAQKAAAAKTPNNQKQKHVEEPAR